MQGSYIWSAFYSTSLRLSGGSAVQEERNQKSPGWNKTPGTKFLNHMAHPKKTHLSLKGPLSPSSLSLLSTRVKLRREVCGQGLSNQHKKLLQSGQNRTLGKTRRFLKKEYVFCAKHQTQGKPSKTSTTESPYPLLVLSWGRVGAVFKR